MPNMLRRLHGAPDATIRILATLDEEDGAVVVVSCGTVRIEMAFPNPSASIPVDETDRKLITLVISQLLTHGVSERRIQSRLGRLAVFGLAKHVRMALESEAPVLDFGGLPILEGIAVIGVSPQGPTRQPCSPSTGLVRRSASLAPLSSGHLDASCAHAPAPLIRP